MQEKKLNINLILGGVLSLLASLLHIGVIFGGAAWYRFFGAGEELATLAEQGSVVPGVITLGIATVLFLWALYAFSAGGLMRQLPLMKLALVVIAAIYLLRGLIVLPVLMLNPAAVDTFAVVSSLICVVYGLFYAIGTKQVWHTL